MMLSFLKVAIRVQENLFKQVVSHGLIRKAIADNQEAMLKEMKAELKRLSDLCFEYEDLLKTKPN